MLLLWCGSDTVTSILWIYLAYKQSIYTGCMQTFLDLSLTYVNVSYPAMFVCFSISLMRSLRLSGLWQISSNPTFWHCSVTSVAVSPVSATTGIASFNLSFINLVAVRPSMTGILRSMRTRSNIGWSGSLLSNSSAFCPFSAHVGEQSRCRKRLHMSFAHIGTSSTTKTDILSRALRPEEATCSGIIFLNDSSFTLTKRALLLGGVTLAVSMIMRSGSSFPSLNGRENQKVVTAGRAE
mmetsp:Transcript_30957/g.51158  ORF Transcript_30957/g.51158 Transcript_30957/m.51158 type:complete len:238 (+) Transcript_30957:184-897(+)